LAPFYTSCPKTNSDFERILGEEGMSFENGFLDQKTVYRSGVFGLRNLRGKGSPGGTSAPFRGSVPARERPQKKATRERVAF
jgi:hypothetical protein